MAAAPWPPANTFAPLLRRGSPTQPLAGRHRDAMHAALWLTRCLARAILGLARPQRSGRQSPLAPHHSPLTTLLFLPVLWALSSWRALLHERAVEPNQPGAASHWASVHLFRHRDGTGGASLPDQLSRLRLALRCRRAAASALGQSGELGGNRRRFASIRRRTDPRASACLAEDRSRLPRPRCPRRRPPASEPAARAAGGASRCAVSKRRSPPSPRTARQ